jgi:long-chain acyl-CoA synthetase
MQTLGELLPELKRLGNREAVRWSNGLRTWVATYAQLYSRIGAAFDYFDRNRIHAGDRVLIRAENRLEWIAVFWACIAHGVEAVPVDYRFSHDLVERIRKESQARLVIDDAALDSIATLPGRVSFTPTPVTPDDIVEIVYTSGTTGEPKGIVHRHQNICANLRPFQKEISKYKKWARPFQPIRILDLLPLSHMFGQSQALFIPVFLEGAVAFTSEIHSSKIMHFVRSNRISVIVSVPRILENLKNEVEREFGKLGTEPLSVVHRLWRYRRVHRRFGWKFWAFVVGGARVDPELEEFWKHLGFAVIQGYGLTEASSVVAVNHPFHSRTGSVGKVVEGQDVRIAEDGEILVRGESVTQTTNGEWLHTGDLGEMDSEGRLYYRGRKKDMIVTPDGLNVHPEDVEAVLNGFPEIRESAVVGVRSGSGEHVHAALIVRNNVSDVDALIRRANDRLETHQRIRDWSIWPHDDFPRTPSTLKIKRQEIARELRSEKPDTRAEPTSPDLSAMSSLERVELLSELENKYQVELDEDAFAKLPSTRELEEWLHQPGAAVAFDQERPPSEWARSAPVRWLRRGFQKWIAIPLYRRYLPLTIFGLENLDGLQPPVIFVANHTSHLDVPTIYTALTSQWRQRLAPAMMKDHFQAYFEPTGRSIKEVGLAAISYILACSLYNAYPLPQKMSGTRRALAYTGELISRGYCAIVFPEGLRTSDGKIQPFRPGIGMMAVRLRIPIVPIRLSGLYEIYSIHDSWPRRGPIRVSIGPPLSFAAETSYQEAAQCIEDAVKKL